MKRVVIILACENMYQGLHGMNTHDVLELEEEEAGLALEYGCAMADDMWLEWGEPDENDDSEEEGGVFYIFRQRDDSPLTMGEAEKLLDLYGYDVTQAPDFDKHFQEWSEAY